MLYFQDLFVEQAGEQTGLATIVVDVSGAVERSQNDLSTYPQ